MLLVLLIHIASLICLIRDQVILSRHIICDCWLLQKLGALAFSSFVMFLWRCPLLFYVLWLLFPEVFQFFRRKTGHSFCMVFCMPLSLFLHLQSVLGCTSTFLPRDALLSAVYAVVVCLSVCLCVCVCVCLSHSGIVSKRLNVGSRK